jgi:hypothetical protein
LVALEYHPEGVAHQEYIDPAIIEECRKRGVIAGEHGNAIKGGPTAAQIRDRDFSFW